MNGRTVGLYLCTAAWLAPGEAAPAGRAWTPAQCSVIPAADYAGSDLPDNGRCESNSIPPPGHPPGARATAPRCVSVVFDGLPAARDCNIPPIRPASENCHWSVPTSPPPNPQMYHMK